MPIIALSLFAASCSNPSSGEILSSAKAITGFTIPGAATTDINPETNTVTVTVPLDTATTQAPAITIEGAGVSPASGVSQNFAFLVPYTVTAADGSAAQWIVTVKWEPLEADIGTYLGSTSGGDSAGDPVPLPVSTDLSGGGWTTLLGVINKYVALDLSECTMGDGVTEFDPGTAGTGKDKIVSLILPDTATSTKAGTYSDPTFKNFTALKSVAGEVVITVGAYAFRNCDALETVSFPEAATIGEQAFASCDVVKTVSLPKAAAIGEAAFSGCDALETVSFPKAATIDKQAFFGCSALETVNFPEAAAIGEAAFWNCGALETVSFPKAATIDKQAFVGCSALETVNLPEATTIGNAAFWGCVALETISLPEAATIDSEAFVGCSALKTVNLPEAATIGGDAFYNCRTLETVSLPKAATIGEGAFAHTGTTASLTITLGDTPPELGVKMFENVPYTDGGESGTKSVTVKVPDNTAWNNIISAYNGANTTNDNWGNAFRGGGWDGDTYLTGEVNENISLTIEVQGGTP